ncbi:MAG: uracil-DNA glycosylase [Chloroflexi bacterium]|nr:uracil-DNA glycosylase [Chloroflexota bacterium]
MRATCSGVRMDIAELNRKISACKKCTLCLDGGSPVPGEGPPDAGIMLIGQNPGAEEARVGRPFVGRSGKYLDSVLEKNGIRRDRLFITSVVKCKTPGNRKPAPAEIATCMPCLLEQIKLLKPRTIVLMGEVAWKTPRLESIRYMETYHPAAAMRFPKIRERFEEDFKKLKEYYDQAALSRHQG